MNATAKTTACVGKKRTILRVVTILTITTILTPVLSSLAGCASSPAVMSNPLPVDTSEYDTLFEASMQVLQDKGFVLDRHDYRFGVVTTLARVSPTIAEPWHRDNTTMEQAVTSTTNYQRRRVSIRLIPDTGQFKLEGDASEKAAPQPLDIASNSLAPSPAGYLLDAQVLIEQVETPRRYLTGSTSQGRMFRDLRAAPANLKDRQISENYWRVISRDSAMEQQLIAQIIRQSTQLARTQAVDAPPE